MNSTQTINNAELTIKVGEIYYVDFPAAEEQGIEAGMRPAIVVSNDIGNQYSPVINVIPLTTSRLKKRRNLPMHVHIPAAGELRDSVAMVEQMRPVSKNRVYPGCLWTVDQDTITKIALAMRVQYPFCLCGENQVGARC